MNNFSSYISRMMKSTILYFSVMFIILNLGLYYINKVYVTESTLQEEDEFVKIFEHIYSENGIEYAVEYAEHFGHIQNTFINLYYSEELVFKSKTELEGYNEYSIDEGRIIVRIDSSSSSNTVLTNLLFITTNLSFLIVFIIGIYIFYIMNRNKTRIMLNDMDSLIYAMSEDKEFQSFTFEEFNNVYLEFHRVSMQLQESKLLKKERLQALNHDLNTSLTVIKSYLEGYLLGRMEISESEIVELLDEVDYNTRLVESLVSDQTSGQRVDLSSLITKLLNKYKVIYKTKSITIKSSIDEGVYVSGNQDTINRILQNVLSNAFYYSDQGTIVDVKLTNDKEVKLTVSDQGIGISSADLENVFSSEFRSEAAVIRHENGKGIGLYMAKTLMNEMNGDITLQKQEVGITAIVTFSS